MISRVDGSKSPTAAEGCGSDVGAALSDKTPLGKKSF